MGAVPLNVPQLLVWSVNNSIHDATCFVCHSPVVLLRIKILESCLLHEWRRGAGFINRFPPWMLEGMWIWVIGHLFVPYFLNNHSQIKNIEAFVVYKAFEEVFEQASAKCQALRPAIHKHPEKPSIYEA